MRIDSAMTWVGAVGFAAQSSVAEPAVILLPVAGLVLAIAFATFILVNDPGQGARSAGE
ncbi:hypothetical protein [Frondihabitans sp. PAMC 28766]|uniref:hypothetical protein n=1 Tax=Frondihabitans sp. PAMC 28766 TaxID=1795630 RepID=UPI0012FF95D6|nr:hypothetical protein [Frondihabitans sp. PAMC 28766]